jgi:RNA polymerase sigma factor (sigma-70 family)
MTRIASLPPRMEDHPPAAPSLPPHGDDGRKYEDLLVRALKCARRFVQGDQAREIAHDVAVEMARRPERQVTGSLLYIAVVYRLRTLWRASERRSTTERAYLDSRSSGTPAWAQPDGGLEVAELRERIEDTLARMPAGMREAFLLVREDELSYREAAARLGVTVGTVHTQLSRANALLRECVEHYHADRPVPRPRTGRQS